MALAVTCLSETRGNPGVYGISDKGFYRIFRGKIRFYRLALPDSIQYPDGRQRAYMYIFIRFTRCIYVG